MIFNILFGLDENHCVVTFTDGETVYERQTVEKGSRVTPPQTTPTKESTPTTDYTFVGWSSQKNQQEAEEGIFDNVDRNSRFYPAFKETPHIYTVTFYNDAEVWDVQTCQYGESVQPKSGAPSKESTPQYNFTFLGWSNQTYQDTPLEGLLDNITSDLNVYAVYRKEIRSYQVQFKNDDGSILKSETLPFGETPTPPETQPTGKYRNLADFKDWTSDVGEVTGETEYTANYQLHNEAFRETLDKSWEEIAADGEANNVDGYKEGDKKLVYWSDDSAKVYELCGIRKDKGAIFTWMPVTVIGNTQVNPKDVSGSYIGSIYQSYIDEKSSSFPDAIKNNAVLLRRYANQALPEQLSNLPFDARFFAPGRAELNVKSSDYKTNSKSPVYTYYDSNPKRIRYESNGSAVEAWTTVATIYNNDPIGLTIRTGGNLDGRYWHNSYGALPAFCLGIDKSTKYDIKWLNPDGSIVATSQSSYGVMPSTGTPSYSDPNHPELEYTFEKWEPDPSNAIGDVEYKAVYSSKVKTFTVTFMDGGTEYAKATVEYGKDAVCPKANPSKPEDSNAKYDFLGWGASSSGSADSNILKNITANETVYAIYQVTYKTRTVTFMNGTTVWDTVTVNYGEKASTSKGNPSKSSTAQYNYTFVGWNSKDGQSSAESGLLDSITENITVYAAYSSTIRQYTVTFMNGSSQWAKVTVDYGGTAKPSSTPTKSSDNYYTYSFNGWSTSSGASSGLTSITNVTSNMTVYATWSSSTRYFTIRFYNGSSYLGSQSATYGSSVKWNGTTPSKASTNYYTYSFNGWSTSSGSSSGSTSYTIYGDTTLYACFSSSTRYYTVYFYNGTTLLGTRSVTYETNLSWNGATPTKASTNYYTYTFDGWTNDGNSDTNAYTSWVIRKDGSILRAHFTSSTRYFTIRFCSYNGANTYATYSRAYNTTVSYSGSTPTRASDSSYKYTFNGWSTSTNATSGSTGSFTVTGDRTYYAAFSRSTRYCAVTAYRSYDNYKIGTKNIERGTYIDGYNTFPIDTGGHTIDNTWEWVYKGYSTKSNATSFGQIYIPDQASLAIYAVFTQAKRTYRINFYTYDAKFLAARYPTYGETVTYSAPYVSGFVFIGWGPNPASVDSTVTYNTSSVICKGNANYYAKYAYA